MNISAEVDVREMVIQELRDVPDTAMLEILDFVRFLKHQTRNLTPEERFDRLWMMAQRIASARGITDEDIEAEVAAVRQGA
ncbi:MAG: hypothetical protein ACLFTI_07870 [Anaerolineales bacterium]